MSYVTTEHGNAMLSAREARQASHITALRALNELSARLWQMPSLQEGLDEMLAATIQMLGANFGNIQLLDPERGVLTIGAQRGFEPPYLEYFREVPAADGSACGRALRTGERIIVGDVETDAGFAPMRDIMRAAECRSVQSTPLIGRSGAPLGMISTLWRAPHQPGELELEQLDLYARQAADFIERQRIDNTRREQEIRQTFLLKLSDVLRPQADPIAIKQTTMQLLGTQLQTNRVAYFEVTDDHYVVEGDYCDGVPTIDGHHPIATFGPGLHDTYRDGRIACDDDTEADPELSRAERAEFAKHQIRAHIGVPLIKGGKFVAGLAVHSALPRAWTDAEIELAGAVAERTWEAVERARAEKLLAESESKYRTLFESMDEGYCVIEVLFDAADKPFDWRFIEVNPAFEWHSGVTDATGKTILELAPDIEPEWFDVYGRVARMGEPIRFEQHSAVLNRWWDTYAFRIGEPEHNRVAVLFTNITERKQTHTAKAARLAAIVDSSDDAIVSKDLCGTMQTWNAAAQRLFGYTAEEAVGQSVTLLIPADRVDEEGDILERIGRGERINHFETVRRRKNGTLVDVSLTISPIVDAAGRIMGASKIARDITERTHVSKALRAADRRKDEFLATLAHELRNPLVPLRNGLEILRENNPNTRENAYAMMMRQLTQLTHRVDDLMDVSRITRGEVTLHMTRIDLAAAARAAVDNTRDRVDAAARPLHVALPAEPVVLLADSERLTQVFTCLLDNAIQYSRADEPIELVLEQEENALVTTVRDNGMGIPADRQGDIFDIFTQLDLPAGQIKEGLGIGLALARQVVELHGGTIEVRSDGLGQGAGFIVRLPLSADEPLHSAAEQPAATQTGKLRLLVADDNHDVADSLALLLGTWDHEVRIANDGFQALDEVAAFQPHAVLLDIGMPRLDGIETAKRLRRTPHGQSITLIALTGWGQPADRDRTTQAGFDYHLVKPAEPDVLEQLLAEIEAQHAPRQT